MAGSVDSGICRLNRSLQPQIESSCKLSVDALISSVACKILRPGERIGLFMSLQCRLGRVRQLRIDFEGSRVTVYVRVHALSRRYGIRSLSKSSSPKEEAAWLSQLLKAERDRAMDRSLAATVKGKRKIARVQPFHVGKHSPGDLRCERFTLAPKKASKVSGPAALYHRSSRACSPRGGDAAADEGLGSLVVDHPSFYDRGDEIDSPRCKQIQRIAWGVFPRVKPDAHRLGSSAAGFASSKRVESYRKGREGEERGAALKDPSQEIPRLTAPTTHAAPESPRSLAGRYITLITPQMLSRSSVCGRGGLGCVRRIRVGDHIFALKVPLEGRACDIASLSREVVFLQKLHEEAADIVGIQKCPRQVSVEGSRFKGTLTPFYDKGSLQIFISALQPMTKDQLRSASSQIVQGLSFLHAGGLTHHDIKPGNIFVASDERRRWGLRFDLADFGSVMSHEEFIDAAHRILAHESLLEGEATERSIAKELLMITPLTPKFFGLHHMDHLVELCHRYLKDELSQELFIEQGWKLMQRGDVYALTMAIALLHSSFAEQVSPRGEEAFYVCSDREHREGECRRLYKDGGGSYLSFAAEYASIQCREEVLIEQMTTAGLNRDQSLGMIDLLKSKDFDPARALALLHEAFV